MSRSSVVTSPTIAPANATNTAPNRPMPAADAEKYAEQYTSTSAPTLPTSSSRSQDRVSRRNASSMPRPGIHGITSTGPCPCTTASVCASAHTAADAGASATRPPPPGGRRPRPHPPVPPPAEPGHEHRRGRGHHEVGDEQQQQRPL